MQAGHDVMTMLDTRSSHFFTASSKCHHKSHDTCMNSCSVTQSKIIHTSTHTQASFGSIHRFREDILRDSPSECQILLVGSKADLTDERTISENEAQVRITHAR